MRGRKRKEGAVDLYFAYRERRISIAQFKASMKDAGHDDDEIDEYLDGYLLLKRKG